MAVLPAFKNARRNSELVALVSDDPLKLKKLSRKYGARLSCTYSEFGSLMASGEVDAVYIATPNTRHREFAEIAAQNAVHVLCEKPLAASADECRAMIRSAEHNNVKLMTAYRLHFDDANLQCVQLAKNKKIGEPRYFHSSFSFQVKDFRNIRLTKELGGGPVPDIGIYCINAARYLFQAEPTEVFATAESSEDPRFAEVEEMVSVSMKFPDHRLATFTISFGAADVADFELVGTRGRLRLENAYEYTTDRKLTLQVGEHKTTRTFKKHDQFSAELLYFSECILEDREIEPSGKEGLIDLEIIEAIQQSIETGRSVSLDPDWKEERPGREQKIVRPGIRSPQPIHAVAPGAERH